MKTTNQKGFLIDKCNAKVIYLKVNTTNLITQDRYTKLASANVQENGIERDNE